MKGRCRRNIRRCVDHQQERTATVIEAREGKTRDDVKSDGSTPILRHTWEATKQSCRARWLTSTTRPTVEFRLPHGLSHNVRLPLCKPVRLGPEKQAGASTTDSFTKVQSVVSRVSAMLHNPGANAEQLSWSMRYDGSAPARRLQSQADSYQAKESWLAWQQCFKLPER